MVELDLVEIRKDQVERLKRFDLSNFPVCYPEMYYKMVANNPLARVCLRGESIIASVTCRIELNGCRKVVYIQTLAVSVLYREQGLGSRLLDFVEAVAKENLVDFITLHVQTSNAAAITFYQKRGFEIIETLPNYYRRIQPTSAHAMEKKL